MGNWMGKIRRNRLIGIRTPWTLADNDVWDRTNRLGGRFAVVVGLVVAATGLLLPPLVSVALLLVGVLSLTLWACVYSYKLYHARGMDRPLV
jgi:uncharacterized membrane protein